MAKATAYRYDAAGMVVKEIASEGPGPDGRWLTADDPVTSWSTLELESDGAPHAVKLATKPGPDGVWLTADDPLKVYSTFTYRRQRERSAHGGRRHLPLLQQADLLASRGDWL